MNIGKYIHELLLENDIVVVPGFGAFVSEYKPAEINEDSDEIKPPSKVVSLNQQIRNNDGLLVGHVAENKRISHFDALKKIEQEREDILYKLDSGEEVELEEVGILFTTAENTIAFKAIDDDNLLLEAYGLEPTAITPEPITEPEEEEVTIPPPTQEKEQVEEEEATEETQEDIPASVKEEEEHTTPVEEEKTEAPQEIQASTIEPAPVEKEEETKKKRGWLWILLVLIPLIAVSVFVFMKGNKDEASSTKAENPEMEISAGVTTDSLQNDTITKTVGDTTKIIGSDSSAIEISTPTETETAGPKYYLVGGSFSVEENANTYLNELKAKGYDAFHVGKKGRFYIVGIGTYNSFNEGEQAKQEYMKNNPGSEVWVYKK